MCCVITSKPQKKSVTIASLDLNADEQKIIETKLKSKQIYIDRVTKKIVGKFNR